MAKLTDLTSVVFQNILAYITDPQDLGAIELTNRFCYKTIIDARLKTWNQVYLFSRLPNPKKKECLALLNPSNFIWPSVKEENFHRRTIRVIWPNSLHFEDDQAFAQMLSIHSITASIDIATRNVNIQRSGVIILKGNRIVYQPSHNEIRFIHPDHSPAYGSYSPNLEFGDENPKLLLPFTSSDNVYMCKTKSNTVAFLTSQNPTESQPCIALFKTAITAANGKKLVLNSDKKRIELMNSNDDFSLHSNDDTNSFDPEEFYIEEEPLLVIPLSSQFELSDRFVLKHTIENYQ
ncbi:hypothetical protein HK096_011304, partial [Nowakowskiella sp. JEL0078]